MRLMRFEFQIDHVPGKSLSSADVLSRAPVSKPAAQDHDLQEDVNLYVHQVIQNLPASERRLEEIRTHLEEDEVCKHVFVTRHHAKK